MNALTTLVLALQVLTSTSQLCSLDYNIKCHFKYKSSKNCNRIGQPCTSIRVLEWMNISESSKTCNYNSGTLMQQSFEIDGYSACASVGQLTRSGQVGANCFCNSNGIQELSRRIRASSSVSFGELPMPSAAPSSAPTLRPTSADTSAPTVKVFAPTISDMESYFNSVCPNQDTMSFRSIEGYNVETVAKKCDTSHHNQPLELTAGFYDFRTMSGTPRGGSNAFNFGSFRHVYYRCHSANSVIRRLSDNAVLAFLQCDGVNRYLEMDMIPKSFETYHSGALVAHN